MCGHFTFYAYTCTELACHQTSALHRAVLTILDMCLHFSDIFTSRAGDSTVTLDVSRGSISRKRHHRSRRQRRQSRNIIGFHQEKDGASKVDESSSSEDESDFDGHNTLEPLSFSVGMSTMSSAEEGFFDRVDKMSTELDGLVRFVRRGTESLAGGTGDAAKAFGVLAFALEDWDL